MSYPIVKDKNGNKLAILNNILNPNVFEKINADYTFNFIAIIEELKTDYIQYGNQIEIDNQPFNIVTYTKERTHDNKMIVQVYCEHVSYELLEESTLFDYSSITAEEALTILLQDTPFKVGNVDYLGKYTFQRDEEEQNKRAQLIDIAQAFKGELVYRGYTVDLYSLRGSNNGVQIRLGKNLKGIKQIIDGTKKDENGNPSVTYEINLLELVEAEEYKDFKALETIRLGDTVRTIDEGLNIDFASRILEYEYDPVRKINSIVVIGNFVENIATDSIETRKVIKEVISKKDIWNRSKAINPDGTVSTAILEGDIDTANNLVKAGLGSVRITDNNGILILDNPDEMLATKALRLLGGVLAISNEKDQSGEWIWRTFGTGDGFVADEIVSGSLYTSLISIVGNKNAPNAFKWDETGFRVHKLNADNSIDLTTFILIDNTGFKFYKNNQLVINIGFDSNNVATMNDLNEFAPKTSPDGLFEITSDKGAVAYKDSSKQEFSQLYGGGVYRVSIDTSTGQEVKKEYFYEKEVQVLGEWEPIKTYEYTLPTNEQVETDLGGVVHTVQLSDNFKGKSFQVVVRPYQSDGKYFMKTIEASMYANEGLWSSSPGLVLEITDSYGNTWDGLDTDNIPIDIKNTASFKVKIYLCVHGRSIENGYPIDIAYATKVKFEVDAIV